ncbi:glycosyl/glycerophosphate transferase, teichoic acid biosynthesis [Brachybacterium faecium DSM 4810]|uniref:Glycosyl/glycerophosphate transferase, teichoic acid biosynthesis n=1 Tax=Brachybacterium faecium (strain ATCC 43885 / DSM 4810 / JCM 11609 / LMG 19847 / NBRC 14762 / NCIMB 9860 / 6-10) TaxID=446465 RepID=C7MHN5_BRAFD|nr:glycosyl/glycerophosphate transferase, teichoic acid biosynthesis [Brachybacterium faecium DSM 4810]
MDVADAHLAAARKAWGDRWTRAIGDRELRKQIFHEFQQEFPCHPDIVLYESMSGAKMMDSPFSLFLHEYGAPDKRRDARLHVWSVRSEETVPPEFLRAPGVLRVKRHTPEYMYYLARATRIVGNSTLPEYFVRRPEQYYLNTWHGIGYKTLGRTDANPLGAGLSVSNMLQSTHAISPCGFMTHVHMHGFAMRNTYVGQFAEAGYPRIDAILNTGREAKLALLQILGCSEERPVVTYAPTWRGDGFDGERLRHDLASLADLDCSTVFLGHHMMLKHVDVANLEGVIVPPDHVNTNELLAATDVLITDYSSIFFDFQVTGRPIVHYLYDYAEYSTARGLTLESDELPGIVVTTSEQLVEAVEHELTRSRACAPSYYGNVERFNPFDKGESSKNVADWFFRADPSGVNVLKYLNVRPRTVFWGGRLGDTSATDAYFDEVEAELSRDAVDVTVFVSRTVRRNDVAIERIRRLGGSVSVVVRDDYNFGTTRAEEEARSKEAGERSQLEVMAYDEIYAREYRRIFGDVKFDHVRIFPGQSFFWRRLAAEAHK